MAEGGIPLRDMGEVIPRFAVDNHYDNPLYDGNDSDTSPMNVEDHVVANEDQPPSRRRSSFTGDDLAYRSSSESDWRRVYFAARVIVCLVFFTLVLVSMTTSNVCLLILTSQLHVSEDVDLVFRHVTGESVHPLTSSPSTNATGASDSTPDSTKPLSTDVMSIWGLFIVLCLPYVCTVLSCVWKVITMQTEILSLRVVFKAMIPDTIHTVGINIFLFYVLPSFDPLTGLFLSVSVAPWAGLLMIRDQLKGSKSFVKCYIVLTFLLSLACFVCFVYQVIIVRQSLTLKVLLPVSLLFISFSWWDNYVVRRNHEKDRNVLERLKFEVGLHRPKLYLILSIWKIIVSFGFTFGNISRVDPQCWRTLMMLDDRASGWMMDTNMILTNKGEDTWIIIIAFICLFASAFCYKTVKYTCKIHAQVVCTTVPFILSFPASAALIFWALLEAKEINSWIGMPVVPDYSLTGILPISLLWSYVTIYWLPVLVGVLLYLFLVPGLHMWRPRNEKFARTQSLFRHPLYCSVLPLLSLILNRNREEVKQETVQRPTEIRSRSMIHLCATMWHEERGEMLQLIKSIFSLDSDARSTANSVFGMTTFDFDAHIFFDDAFDKDNEVNGYVKRLGDVIRTGERMQSEAPTKYQTPYGGRLDWKLPNGHTLHVHMKDKRKIRTKKRWSQVMYIDYLIGHKIMDKAQNKEEGRRQAENTFILTLDGDVDFQPHAVHTLLDRIKANSEVGSLCGRIHPIGSGPMIWYQKFEYSVSHWLQKAAENMFGCVLCSPGCFSIFRASALMDVKDKYTTQVTSAFQKIQFDLGEDRWLCTLLLQKGYRVEYTAAADSYTFAPEGFVEFFKQRRRWTPSTMANTYDLVRSWRETTANNSNITLLFIIYQLGLLVTSVVTPGTIFMLVVGALSSAFPTLTLSVSFIINLVPIVLFVLLNLKCSQHVQAYYAQVLTIFYCLLMTVVLVGIIKQAAESGFCSASTIFLTAVTAVFLTAAVLHPQEGFMLLYGPLYFLMIPCTSLLMVVYSIANINDTSWGTRDANIYEATPQIGILDQLPGWLKLCVKCFMPAEEPRISQEGSEPSSDGSPHDAADIELEPYKGQSMDLSEEYDFWVQLIDRHLYPEKANVNTTMKRDLTTIRNNAFLGFILINAIFIILLFSLESIAQQTSNLAIELPCYDTKFKPERIQPIAMAFTMVFGVFLLLQWFGMNAHRFSTLLQVVASSQAMDRSLCPCCTSGTAEPVSRNDISRIEDTFIKTKTKAEYSHVEIEDERQADKQRREQRMKYVQDRVLTEFWGDILNIAVCCYRDKSLNIMQEIRASERLRQLPSSSKNIVYTLIKDAYHDIENKVKTLNKFAQSIKDSVGEEDKRLTQYAYRTVRRIMVNPRKHDGRSVFR